MAEPIICPVQRIFYGLEMPTVHFNTKLIRFVIFALTTYNYGQTLESFVLPMWHCMMIFLQVCKPFSLYHNRMMLTGL